MRVFLAAAVAALVAGSAYAQGQVPVPQYGAPDKEKTPQEIQAEKDAQKAYQRSLGNIPDKGVSDPWGSVRSDNGSKPVAKAAPAKRTKTGDGAN